MTGVGVCIRRGEPLIAPSDENKRYDDYGFKVSEKVQVSPGPISHSDPEIGYLFHESCWKLLKARLLPSPVPIQTLYNVCRSSPIPSPGLVNLGLDYWGFMRDPVSPDSWHDSHILRRLTARIGSNGVTIPATRLDPFDIPKLEQCLGETLQPGPPEDTGSRISPSFQSQPDTFSRLPPELLEEIRVFLASRDVTNLHLSSRTFASLPLSQYFWASRFRGTLERSHIFEPTILELDNSGSKPPRDWKSLYHKAASSKTPPDALWNRERIWNCFHPLANLFVTLPPVDDTTVRDFEGVCTETEVFKATSGWRCISGDFRPRSPSVPSSMACNIRFEQNIRVPKDLEQIAISTLPFCGQQNITGIRLISRKTSDTHLGYVLPGKETILNLVDQDGGQDTLTGFICALDKRGIHGLRAVTSGGHLSEWVGSSIDLPQTLRLCVERPISELKAAFDVCEFFLSFLYSCCSMGLIRSY